MCKKYGTRKEANQDTVITVTSNRCSSVTGFGAVGFGPHYILKLLPIQVVFSTTTTSTERCHWMPKKNLVIIPEFTFLVFTSSFGRAPGTAPQQAEFSTTEMWLISPSMLGCPEVLRIHFGSSTQHALTSSQAPHFVHNPSSSPVTRAALLEQLSSQQFQESECVYMDLFKLTWGCSEDVELIQIFKHEWSQQLTNMLYL